MSDEQSGPDLSAPSVTEYDLESAIVHEYYFTASEGVSSADWASEVDLPPGLSHITFCVLLMKNGCKIVGVNEGPVSAANFDPEVGKIYARQKALDQMWPLLGYALRDKLYHEPARAS